MGHAGCQACCHKGSGLKTEWKPESVTQEMTDASIAAGFGGDLERARESGREGAWIWGAQTRWPNQGLFDTKAKRS